ncbi:MAG TPA: prephenate dehydratase domain-containing protein [Gemmatales bacterium]|nr:prephenate dehydratase domain-containing protein [Gemmatales bacterium]HMP60752.1 prephenate dehydratase domain-containing protein [Gemmatales bacterium]
MSKKSESPKSAAQLRALRSQIDKIDGQILKLVNERAATVQELGPVKNEHGTEAFSLAREDEILSGLMSASKGPLDQAALRVIFREIISASRALQKNLKVAYLRPDYSNTHQAAIERFGTHVEFVGVGSVATIFEEVNRGHTDFGVLPLENATEARLGDTLELFMRMPQIKLCGEIRLRVHLHLLSNVPQPEIRRVYSTEYNFARTRPWLSKHVPQAHLAEVSSATTASELVLREPGAAAVASRQVANRFGIRVLFDNIEENAGVEMRFGLISLTPAERTGHARTSLLLQLASSSGELADVLAAFKQQKLNVNVVESFLIRTSKPQFFCFIDFDGHMDEPKVKRIIESANKLADKVQVLGSYPQSEPVD